MIHISRKLGIIAGTVALALASGSVAVASAGQSHSTRPPAGDYKIVTAGVTGVGTSGGPIPGNPYGTVAPGFTTIKVACPRGGYPVGGGYNLNPSSPVERVLLDAPYQNGNIRGWKIVIYNAGPSYEEAQVIASCIRTP